MEEQKEPITLSFKLELETTESMEKLAKVKTELEQVLALEKEIAELKGQVSERQITCNISIPSVLISPNDNVDEIVSMLAERLKTCSQVF